jgi:hypothetical protein
MYRSFAQLREGWTKNLALLFPDALWLGLRRGAEFGAIFGGGIAAWSFRAQPVAAPALAALALITAVLCLRRVARAHMGALNSALAVLGLPIFSYLLLRSFIHYRGGKLVSWKGRTYAPPVASRATSAAVPEATHH